MTAIAGTDPANWRDGIGLFGTGTRHGRRDRGDACPRVTVRQSSRRSRKLAIKVRRSLSSRRPTLDSQEMDFGTVVRRRTNQAPPAKGGWNVFFTLIDRSIPNTNPYGNQAIRADGMAVQPPYRGSARRVARRRGP